MGPAKFKRLTSCWTPLTGVTQRSSDRVLGVSQRNSVLGSLGACDAGDDVGKIKTDRVVVLRDRGIRRTEQALTAAVRFNQRDFLF